MIVTELNLEERKIIFNAVRLYQMNKVGLTSKAYQVCDDILNKLFDDVKVPVEKPSTTFPIAPE
jgi:predicted double-glycine peptidase